MHGYKALLILVAPLAAAADFSGASALRFTGEAVAFGPRPPGSAAHGKLHAYILAQLKNCRCEIAEDSFTALTPTGSAGMKNVIARFPGSSGRAIAITGHYDTKVMPGLRFVGANDGGSSTGFLLEMARALATRPRRDDVYLVWLDGEEAFATWSNTDGTYGSRHLARRWASDGTASRLKALINIDMIGDRDLGIHQELGFSSPALRKLVWQVAGDLGYQRHFLDYGGPIEDDHVPFVRSGVNAVNLIDFDYGPGNSYWHTEQDTMDKLSASSFEVVGQVVLELIRRLEQ